MFGEVIQSLSSALLAGATPPQKLLSALRTVQVPQTASRSKPTYLYLPWIPQHSDAVVARVFAGAEVEAIPFQILTDAMPETRLSAMRLAREYPRIWRYHLMDALSKWLGQVDGFVLTFDWHPVTREIVHVCRMFGIRTILVPHESVFINEHLYYNDKTGPNTPLCDHALLWGDLQRRIFTKRGYPESRIEIVGAPKFDHVGDYRPRLDRSQYCSLFGLEPRRDIILFATQPLDLQVTDRTIALRLQETAIRVVVDFAFRKGLQVVVRKPPSSLKIFSNEFEAELEGETHVAFDGSSGHLASPEDAIHHARIVVAINSTMLFEAKLMGKPAIAADLIGIDSFWSRAGIPCVTSVLALEDALAEAYARPRPMSEAEYAWAAAEFSNGTFDGKASERIRGRLTAFASPDPTPGVRPNLGLELIEQNLPLHASHLASPNVPPALESCAPALLGVDNFRTFGREGVASPADLYVQFGSISEQETTNLPKQCTAYGRDKLVVCPGALDLFTRGRFADRFDSITLDYRAAYYESRSSPGLVDWLDKQDRWDEDMLGLARRAMDHVIGYRMERAKHRRPPASLKRDAVLLVMDAPETHRGSGPGVRNRMMNDARERFPSSPILVVSPNKDRIEAAEPGARHENLHVDTTYLADDFDLFTVADTVSEIWVETSIVGFEGLLLDKPVKCYGQPFYAGWGLTDDILAPPVTRSRGCSIEQLSAALFVAFSRYRHPSTGEPISLDRYLDAVSTNG
jgi:hypothetical protein